MKKELTIAIWGYGKPLIDILPVVIDDGIRIAYVRFDQMRSDSIKWIEQIEVYGIKVYSDYYPIDQVDLVFVINYNKIVTDEELAQSIFLNYHVGLLPKWRGNSANGWAIINAENEVGYTLHRIVSQLDAGNIYYRFVYPYAHTQTYIDARRAMDKNLKEHICSVIRKVYDAPDDYCAINEGEFVYCSKLRPIDGDISNWRYTTEEIVRRHYVFAPPLGTGLKFMSKGKLYEILKLSKIDNFANSVGIPGGVVYFNNKSMWVKTLDTAISIDSLQCEGKYIDMISEFMIGQRL